MKLWIEFVACVGQLRGACTRKRTFLWMSVILVAWAARSDLLGVTSFVRASFLGERCYHLLLNLFHTRALMLGALTKAWIVLAMKLFNPVREGGYVIFAADGLKVAKEGKKMPAVKCLHQESGDNSKAEFIMGHSIQVVSMLVAAPTGQVFAVPLMSRISEGLRWGRKSDEKSLLDKLVDMFIEVVHGADVPALLVADAYYASRTVIDPLLANGCQLVTRVRSNAVAYREPPNERKRTRGRPKKYGEKVKVANLFHAGQSFTEAPSPVYGEKDVTILYRHVDLLWKPVGKIVRFVLVKHPTRGRIVLLCTDLEMDPLNVIKIYGLRFKIEVSFKHALHTLGAYAYHFWMMPMTPIKRHSGNQRLANRDSNYRDAVARKMDAYHRYIQLGCIVQGLILHLAINYKEAVWKSFNGWLRTMKPDLVPSEMVVAQALRNTLPEYLLNSPEDTELTKFITDHAEPERLPGITMAA